MCEWQMSYFKSTTLMKKIQSHCGNLVSVIWWPQWSSTHNHISIPNRLHFINVVVIYCGIETGVKIIEKVNNFKRSGVSRNRGKTNNIWKIDCDFRKLFRIHRKTKFQLFCHGAVLNETRVISLLIQLESHFVLLFARTKVWWKERNKEMKR